MTLDSQSCSLRSSKKFPVSETAGNWCRWCLAAVAMPEKEVKAVVSSNKSSRVSLHWNDGLDVLQGEKMSPSGMASPKSLVANETLDEWFKWNWDTAHEAEILASNFMQPMRPSEEIVDFPAGCERVAQKPVSCVKFKTNCLRSGSLRLPLGTRV